MRPLQSCVHGVLVNDTCVCDLLWQGDSCQQRDCQAGQLRDNICHCHLRHAGEFCEYHACYHKDVLYCWGLKDVEFLPCNASAVGNHVDPDTVKNPAWYCPCGEGRRTPPPYSHCVCSDGYGGEFCALKNCGAADGCANFVGGQPGFNSGGNAAGIVVPDSVKVALVCMSMVVLVALVVWLKRVCFRQRGPDGVEMPPESGVGASADPRTRHRRNQHHNPLTPAQLSATLLMLQTRQNYPCDWEGRTTANQAGRRGAGHNSAPRPPAPLPTYDEANSAPPSYSSVIIAQRKASALNDKSISRKGSIVADPEAANARVRIISVEAADTSTRRVVEHRESLGESRPNNNSNCRRSSL